MKTYEIHDRSSPDVRYGSAKSLEECARFICDNDKGFYGDANVNNCIMRLEIHFGPCNRVWADVYKSRINSYKE